MKSLPIKELLPTEDRLHSLLEERIDYLNSRLNTSFSVMERERKTPTGLSADLWLEDEDSREEGVVECQLGASDHDHLGKLITYLTTFDAKIGVWIVEEPRYEHEKAIDWLNETTDMSFYLVRIEAIQVGESKAPLFTPISVPSPEVKEVGKIKGKVSETDIKRKEFWEGLLQKSKEEGFTLFETISPKPQCYIGKGAGISGFSYVYVIGSHWSRVELSLNADRDTNKEVFDKLHSMKEEIEKGFGDELEWDRMNDKKSSRISKRVTDVGLNDAEEWSRIQEEMIDAMRRLNQAFEEPLTEV